MLKPPRGPPVACGAPPPPPPDTMFTASGVFQCRPMLQVCIQCPARLHPTPPSVPTGIAQPAQEHIEAQLAEKQAIASQTKALTPVPPLSPNPPSRPRDSTATSLARPVSAAPKKSVVKVQPGTHLPMPTSPRLQGGGSWHVGTSIGPACEAL